jgi:hypothetical protein
MYLIVILSFLINPLAAHGMQWEHNACAEMQQMAEYHSQHLSQHHSQHLSQHHSQHLSQHDSQHQGKHTPEHNLDHDCCEKDQADMVSQQPISTHNCDTCSDCQTQWHSNGCLFSASLFNELIFRQHDYLSISPPSYPTPLQERVIPPIA